MTRCGSAGAGVYQTPALCFERVVFGYRGSGPPALNGVDFALRRGEIVALVGRNGAGKSTVARLAAGLSRPHRGRVLVGGAEGGRACGGAEGRALVGLLFQDPDRQVVGVTVEEDIAFGLENLGVPAGEMKVRVETMLEHAGLAARRSVAVAALSGGERQKLALAGVLVLEPCVLVLDEPTSLLARRERLSLREEMVRQACSGTAVLWITHRMEEVLWADRVVGLEGGIVAYDGDPSEFFRDGQAENIGLGLPPAAELASALYGGRQLLSEEAVTAAVRRTVGMLDQPAALAPK